MHPIIQNFVTQFSRERAIDPMQEEDKFERFVNHCIISNRCPTRFDVEDVTTDHPEVGIDGVAIIVGDDLVTTATDAQNILSKRQRDIDVTYMFLQSKRSEHFERDAFLNLGSAVRDILHASPELPRDSHLTEAAKMHRTIIENVSRLRNGQPNCQLFYATTGIWSGDTVLEATRAQIVNDLKSTRFFHSVECVPLGFDELKREWMATRAPPETKFSVLGELPMPAMEGVSEALIVLVNANEFIQKVLCDSSGNLRASVFEQNVRHFLGDNEVNDGIQKTLRNERQKHRFAILNNGITITAREIRRVSNTISIKDFQIVNGCQTSHVLYHNRNLLDGKVVLVVKAISSTESGVVDEVVTATNSQTKVTTAQFYAIKDEARSIQTFFQSYPDNGNNNDPRKLYFERRVGEFAGQEIIAFRIFDIHLLVKVFGSMFLDLPHDASGSPSRIYEHRELFKAGHEIAYYTAAFAYNRIASMRGNKQLPPSDGILKWHILTALKYLILGSLPLTASQTAIHQGCERILREIWKQPKDCLKIFESAAKLVRAIPRSVGDQELRAKPFTDRLVADALNKHRSRKKD